MVKSPLPLRPWYIRYSEPSIERGLLCGDLDHVAGNKQKRLYVQRNKSVSIRAVIVR